MSDMEDFEAQEESDEYVTGPRGKRKPKGGETKHEGRGRPPKWPKIDLDRVTQFAESGMTNLQIAVALGVSEDTVYDWKLNWVDFSEALKRGKTNPDDEIERSLFERARGYSHVEEKVFCTDGVVTKEKVIKHYPPDPVSGIFWLCNRRKDKWRHVSHIEHSGPNGDAIDVNVTSEQAKAVLDKLRHVEGAGAVG